jgi:hypothetical protein
MLPIDAVTLPLPRRHWQLAARDVDDLEPLWESWGSPELWYASTQKPRGESKAGFPDLESLEMLVPSESGKGKTTPFGICGIRT